MKRIILFTLISLIYTEYICAQDGISDNYEKEIHALIKQYSKAREIKDSVLLKSILVDDMDQLVSTGEWRVGEKTAVEGMQKSSRSTPGTRILEVEKIRILKPGCYIVDARYIIKNADGTKRTMWSTFIIVNNDGLFEIAAIRNMLPAGR